jgi:Protein of unknown function (DUF3300)/Chaperone of endosialidase
VRKLTISITAGMLMCGQPFAALAQVQSPPAAAPAPAPTSVPDQQQLLGPDQLDQLVAPIALYPDALLSEVLMASTYPLEVVQADRWVSANKNLKSDALKDSVQKQDWDDSVKSLTATPSVLSMMSEKLDWTQNLGDAVLAQQPDVMDAIQRLRTKAQTNNKLKSTPQQTVSTQSQGSKQVIVIAPTQPDTVYVPYYDPSVVYGPWPYPAYPPYYFPPPGYIAGGLIAGGIAFGAGYAVGRWVSGGNYWGGGFNWGGNNINVNRNNVNINNWQHNSYHRRGVAYTNNNVRNQFGNNAIRNGAQNRVGFRGRSGNQVLNPGGGNRSNIGGGAGGAGNRPNLGGGAGGGNRPNVGGGGNRPNVGGGGGGNRPGRDTGLGNIQSRNATNQMSQRGRTSLSGGSGGGSHPNLGGGSGRGGAHVGGGGGRGGGGGGRGGGRRSDIRLKHDIVLLGHLDNSLGFYRFVYNGGDKAYVGVMAQEVQAIAPGAVTRGTDGYLRVYYDRLGLKFQTYDEWLALGALVPSPVAH